MNMEHGKTPTTGDPLVSVIVPAYNAGRYIDQCLTSIEDQTYTNLEIFLVDDGSTDDTLERMRSRAARDERIEVLTQENRYAGVARNYGFSRAKGDFVMFLDADDFFEPEMIERMVARARATEADVVVCRSNFYDDVTGEVKPIDYCLRYVDPASVKSGCDLSEVMFRFCNGWPWDKLYRAEFVRGAGLEFQDLRTTNDAFFVFMSLMIAERIAFVDEPLVMHRTNNAGSLERTRSKSWDNAMRAAFSIEEGMKRFGVYETFERSYLNWLLNFSLWNFETLEDDAKNGLLEKIEEHVVPRLPAEAPDDFYYSECDKDAAELLRATRFEAVRKGLELDIKLDHERDGIAYLRGWIDATEQVVREREAEIQRLREENERLLQSTTYTVGKAVMNVPCTIKDLFSKKEHE